MNWYKTSQQINIGYRANSNSPNSFAGTEGNGIYVARDIELAQFFGNKIVKIEYKQPRKPLIVDEEPLPILQEDYDIFAPITSNDSEWIRINKQAIQEVGLTQEEWDQTKACQSLTNLLKKNGYDMVRVTSGGESWDVLLDPSLIISSIPTQI